MARSTFVYVSYIRTTPEKLWSALTDAEFMKQYWFGVHGESKWPAGHPGQGVYPGVHVLGVAPPPVMYPLAAPGQARTQSRMGVALHDRTRTERDGSQALDYSH